VMYESVHRITDCMADLVDILGADRQAFIGRELTKMYEQCVQETLGELKRMVDDGDIVGKGEFALVLSGAEARSESAVDVDRMLIELGAYLSAKDAAKVAASLSGHKKNELYQRLLELKNNGQVL